MQLNITRYATRLHGRRLVLAAALVAVPATTLLDRVASAESNPNVAVAPAVELEAAVESVLSDASKKTNELFDSASWSDVAVGAINPRVFAMALHAASVAVDRGEAEPGTLTVIDFSRPSTERRMWVYDLRSKSLLFEELVSHGRNSGMNIAKSFSNVAESNMSSIGLYRAAEAYIGKHGYSLRLDGLDRGFNDRARERAIVIHGAEYVSEAITRAQGRLGRSLGCPAVRPEVSRKLIDAVKGGGLVFAYYPDQNWLRASPYAS
jgi:hypothetical protein